MVTDGWYCCPACGKHVQKIERGSVIYNTPLFCRSCKMDWYPTIYMGAELDDDTHFIHRHPKTEET